MSSYTWRVKYLLVFVIMMLTASVIIASPIEESDLTLLYNKQAYHKSDQIQVSTEQPTLQTSSQPENNFFTIEHGVKILPETPKQLELSKKNVSQTTTQRTTLAVRELLKHQVENETNERPSMKKFSSYQEAKKAYFSLHGHRISETKCTEYENIHCKLEHENRDKLVELFKHPHREGQVDGVGIGGRDTGFGEYPHMGALGWIDITYQWSFKCGSSLISRNFLLTAAHCTWVSPRQFNLLDPRPQIVRLGNKNIVNSQEHMDVTIQQIIVHPAYKSPSKYSDIALMKLVKDVVFDLYMLPACLWQNPVVEAGTAVFGTGWGYTDVAVKNMSVELQSVDIKIIDSDKCDSIVEVGRNRNFKGIRTHQICAGVLEGGVDTCQGDSGGPIQVKDPHVCMTAFPLSTVIGVTSFGFGCARAGMPSVYTRVSSFIDWIEENVWKEELYL